MLDRTRRRLTHPLPRSSGDQRLGAIVSDPLADGMFRSLDCAASFETAVPAQFCAAHGSLAVVSQGDQPIEKEGMPGQLRTGRGAAARGERWQG